MDTSPAPASVTNAITVSASSAAEPDPLFGHRTEEEIEADPLLQASREILDNLAISAEYAKDAAHAYYRVLEHPEWLKRHKYANIYDWERDLKQAGKRMRISERTWAWWKRVMFTALGLGIPAEKVGGVDGYHPSALSLAASALQVRVGQPVIVDPQRLSEIKALVPQASAEMQRPWPTKRPAVEALRAMAAEARGKEVGEVRYSASNEGDPSFLTVWVERDVRDEEGELQTQRWSMTGRDVPYWALQDLAKRLGLNPATLEELAGYR